MIIIPEQPIFDPVASSALGVNVHFCCGSGMCTIGIDQCATALRCVTISYKLRQKNGPRKQNKSIKDVYSKNYFNKFLCDFLVVKLITLNWCLNFVQG